MPASRKNYNVGDALPDGWIFLGISPVTKRPYSLEPTDNGGMGDMSLCEAWVRAEAMEKAGYTKPRMPIEEYHPMNTERGSEWDDIFNKIVKGRDNKVANLNGVYATPHTGDSSGCNLYPKPYVTMISLKSGNKLQYPFFDSNQPFKTRLVRDEPRMSVAVTETGSFRPK